jgi:flavin-dependent dehydrogenase
VTFDIDIAIVGGGPAGTSTALHLVRREGIRADRIAIFEKASHPRDKPCAGAVSAWGLDALAAIDVALDVPSVPMRGLRILAAREIGEHACDANEPLGVLVRRSEFDASLFRRAGADGVEVHDGEGLVALERVVGGFRLTTTKRTLSARFVAACDGAGSVARKLVGLREHARKGHLYVLDSDVTSRDDGPRRDFCDFDLAPCDAGLEGYYWDFPTLVDGRRAVSRGIYHANFTPKKDVKAALARALAARGIDVARVTLKPFSTRPFVRGAPLALARFVLVGEAAGIDQTTGEGIAQAILFGGIAAKHLARALRTGSASLDAYARDVVRSRMGRHLLQSAWLARRVYGPRGAPWQKLLVRSSLAREAGARWYEGRPLSLATKLRLAARLATSL